MGKTGVALCAPGVELIGIGRAVFIVAGGIAFDHNLFIGMQRSGFPVSGRLAVACPDGNHRGVARFIYLYAIKAGPKQRKGYLGRVDLISLGIGESGEINRHHT
jgi:hypothetical protein